MVKTRHIMSYLAESSIPLNIMVWINYMACCRGDKWLCTMDAIKCKNVC